MIFCQRGTKFAVNQLFRNVAKITKTLSSLKNGDGKSEILLRFSGGRGFVFRAKSGIFVAPSRWSQPDERIIVPRIETAEQRELLVTRRNLDALCQYIIDCFVSADKTSITPDWLTTTVRRYHHPDFDKPVEPTFFERFDEFLNERKYSHRREQQFTVVERALRRFELYTNRHLTLDEFGTDELRAFWAFLRDEHSYIGIPRYDAALVAVPECRPPAVRGTNAIIAIFIKLRTFIIWANKTARITTNNAFDNYTIPPRVYGTPYFISIEERDAIAAFDFDAVGRPALSVQRDIFIFQCLVGCRVGDLNRLTTANIINGALEYIPHKTMDGRPVTVRVPLTAGARAIIERYAKPRKNPDDPPARLLPFIAQTNYNESIKDIFRLVGLTRFVTILNPKTREEEQRPLNEIASSHLARRTFIGNLYKQVQDPNLIGALSGHCEGSRAFARYRTIDEQMKTDLVNLLERTPPEK